MWSNWGESAKASLQQAIEKTGDALDKAGESLTKAAVSAGKAARHEGEQGEGGGEQGEGEGEEEQQQQEESTSSSDGAKGKAKVAEPNKQQEILKNFQTGWSSVVQQTRQSMSKAQHLVEEQQSKLQQTIKEEQHKMQQRVKQARTQMAKRDINLPLDVAALKDAQVVYVTDRIISMGHPALDSSVDGKITGERKLAAVGHLLQRRHSGRYMVWNISEVDYDVDMLDNQVLTYSFPGSPSPPLGLLLKLLVSMESWLQADARNVAVVHCLTGKGRTSTVLAAFLCWMGEAQFSDIYTALEYMAQCKQISTDELTIPSQRRYVSYFKNMLDGVRPSQPPLKLKRVIMSQAPRYTRRSPESLQQQGNDEDKSTSSSSSSPSDKSTKKEKEPDEAQLAGCVPYLQIFKAGKLIHTAPASLHREQNPNELPFCSIADGSISFNIDQVVQGDVLIRCRHLTLKKQRISMFRAAFHTGYVPPNVMRLAKSQLDGACSDDRFEDDFYLDVIFEPVDAEEASVILAQQQEAEKRGGSHHNTGDGGDEQAAVACTDDTTAGKTVTASAYDTMLHRDSRFWDVIAKRKELHAKQTSEAAAAHEKEDPYWGPTVGRRREFGKKGKNNNKKASSSGGGSAAGDGKDAATTVAAGGSTAAGAAASGLETFSIGNEFDFMPSEDDAKPSAPTEGGGAAATTVAPPPKQKKPDSLMEALMGALDDDDEEVNETEAIIFDYEEKPETEPAPTIVQIPPAPGTTAAQPAAVAAATSAAAPLTMTAAEEAKKDSTEKKQDEPKKDDKKEPTTAEPTTVESTVAKETTNGPAPSTPAQAPAAASTTTTTPAPAAAPAAAAASTKSDVDDLLASGVDDDEDVDDADMDALLADAGADVADLNLDDLDVDDDDLQDLENFLTSS